MNFLELENYHFVLYEQNAIRHSNFLAFKLRGIMSPSSKRKLSPACITDIVIHCMKCSVLNHSQMKSHHFFFYRNFVKFHIDQLEWKLNFNMNNPEY